MARVGILTLSALELAVESGQRRGQVSHFLDKCYFCKKGLCQDDETFMFGDFGAFCTPQFHTKQIAADNEKEKVSKQSTGTKSVARRVI